MTPALNLLAQANTQVTGVVATCVRCRRSLPRQHKAMRFCSSRCKTADLRDRRAQARADLLDALTQLRVVEARVEAALTVLGLNPTGNRSNGSRSIDGGGQWHPSC